MAPRPPKSALRDVVGKLRTGAGLRTASNMKLISDFGKLTLLQVKTHIFLLNLSENMTERQRQKVIVIHHRVLHIAFYLAHSLNSLFGSLDTNRSEKYVGQSNLYRKFGLQTFVGISGGVPDNPN